MTMFAGNDPDQLAADALSQMRKVEDFQSNVATMVGNGSALNGLVTAQATGADGLSAIVINPRAMRSPSEDLSEAVLTAVRDALADLQRQTFDAMREILGDEMVDAATGKSDPLDIVKDAEHRFKMSVDEAMAELDKIRRQDGFGR